MLHRKTVIAKAGIPLSVGALNGELGRILARLMKSCVDQQVTGALVLDSGHIMAVFEGDAGALRGLRNMFELDGRHSNFNMLERTPIAHREFHTWSVGAQRRGSEPSRLVKSFQTIVPTADEVRMHIRHLISQGVIAESPPLIVAAA